MSYESAELLDDITFVIYFFGVEIMKLEKILSFAVMQHFGFCNNIQYWRMQSTLWFAMMAHMRWSVAWLFSLCTCGVF